MYQNKKIQMDVDEEQLSAANCKLATESLPQGVKDSIEAAGPQLAMPVVTAICPCIGALATGVRLDVHGQSNGLNLIAYIAGDYASGKGQIDAVVDAWMSEVAVQDKSYQDQEDEWRRMKRVFKNSPGLPDEPKLPVRFLTLNNTLANLAERLANTRETRILVHARGRPGGAEVEVVDERLLRDVAPKLRRQQV